ncbi:ABC transporter permease [Planosporangium thailandense]|uniref:ABC transporter permease n=1 Tax=Planosporangium thailandense TaxID=765197 RepID=A0ABX0XTI3_9ACTN|nr:ABC transporter permease [Planosporangium thailandense]NJC69202.1 ABC transporter permease [Planosporangium thailandense]
MSYDDPRYRGEHDQEDGGFPYADTYPDGGDYSYPGERTDSILRGGYSPPNLDDVFDDPAAGEPGRDRFGVHLVWELLLLFAVAAFGYVLYRDSRFAVTGDGLRTLMISATTLGLLVLAAGLSLRAAVPNLAVGPVAVASALYFADHAGRGVLISAGQAVVLALAVGAAIAVVTVGLHVPAWAASFGASLAVVLWIQRHHHTVELGRGVYQPVSHAPYWFGGFAALAVLGALLGAVRPVRRVVGRFRPVGDSAQRRGGAAAGISALALLGSSALASAAGVLTALQDRTIEPVDQSLALTGLALGGALLAGTSAFGRRGGLLGTALAAALLAEVLRYLRITHPGVSQLAVAAAAIGAGLVATRAVEAFGRPQPAAEQPAERWRTIAPTTTTTTMPAAPADDTWGGSRPTGWTSPLPASTPDDRWRDDWDRR